MSCDYPKSILCNATNLIHVELFLLRFSSCLLLFVAPVLDRSDLWTLKAFPTFRLVKVLDKHFHGRIASESMSELTKYIQTRADQTIYLALTVSPQAVPAGLWHVFCLIFKMLLSTLNTHQTCNWSQRKVSMKWKREREFLFMNLSHSSALSLE